ncbi:MAG: hypothetical protein KH196_12760 [Oscillospiraceae bacterium]|jgi:hypothetical protein|nr:hypothetical protein [Oscillospiraceae bacterium]
MTASYNMNIYSGAVRTAKVSAERKHAAGIAAQWPAVRAALAHKLEQFRCAHPVITVAACVVGVPAGILGGVAAATALVISPLALVLGW